MNKNACPRCNIENEADYKYCKNCGMQLAVINQPSETERSDPQTQPNFHHTAISNNSETAYTEGIPDGELAVFIGKKHHDIIPKFKRMEITDSKISWCWPVAILGFLLGPFGASLWFYFRKMYKPAILLSCIGATLTIITAILTCPTTANNINAAANFLLNGNFEQFEEDSQEILAPQTLADKLADSIEDATSLLTGVLCGIYGFYLYKNHCVNKIKEFKTKNIDSRYYSFGLASLGGVSGGMLALGIGIMATSSSISSLISVVYTFIT